MGFEAKESVINFSKYHSLFCYNRKILKIYTLDTWKTQGVTRMNLYLSLPRSIITYNMRGPTCIPAWVLWCWIPSGLLGASAGADYCAWWSTSFCASFSLLSLVVLLVKRQMHPRYRLTEDGRRLSERRQHKLLDIERVREKKKGGFWGLRGQLTGRWVFLVDRFNVCSNTTVLFLVFSRQRRSSPEPMRGAEWSRTD